MNNGSDKPAPTDLNDENEELLFSGVLGFNSVKGWREYAAMATKYLEISKTGTLRLVVLETWLFLDYTVANLLISGLQITGVDVDSINLREEVLPSFARSLQLVTKIRERNRQLTKPAPKMVLPMEFFSYLRKNEPTLLEQLIQAEDHFLESIGLPGETAAGRMRTIRLDHRQRWVSDQWLEMAERIDDSWRAKAEQLDRARNKAAHSYDELAIAAKLGFKGTNALELAKAECRSVASALVGVDQQARWISAWSNLAPAVDES